jgi:hypothetical protein
MHSGHTFFMRAVSAAIEITAGLHTMTNYLATAVLAFGCESVDGTFETIEVMRDAIHHYFDRLVIFVSAHFTSIHMVFPLLTIYFVLRSAVGRMRTSGDSQ